MESLKIIKEVLIDMIQYLEHYIPDFKHSQRRQADAQEEIAKQLKRIADLKENKYLEKVN